jgi:hypothetical protein
MREWRSEEYRRSLLNNQRIGGTMYKLRRIHMTIVVSLVLIGLSWSVGCGSEEVASDSSNVESPETSSAAITDVAVSGVIQNYFSCYYKSLEQLEIDQAIWEYIVDTDETHLYLGALQYGINWRKALDSGRIADSQVQGVEMVYSKPGEDGAVDIRAYVRVGFRYLDGEFKGRTSMSDNWYITCKLQDGQLKVVALDSNASDYGFAKELMAANLKKKAGNTSYTKTDAIDDAYVVINSRIEEFRGMSKPPTSTE